MNDKDFVDRMKIAVDYYKSSINSEPVDLHDFMNWLYSLYGILPPENRK